MMKPKKPQFEAPEKLSTVVRRFIFSILLYPVTIVKKYNNYNIRLGEMINESNDTELDRNRKNNAKLVMNCIYLPLMLGIMVSGYFVYNHIDDFAKYKAKIERPIPSDGLFSSIGAMIKKGKIIVQENPIKRNDYIFIFYGYLASLVGAKFLSLNFVFKEEDRISNILGSLGYVDADGNPWQVTYTPDAIMVEAFHCNPTELCNNTRFWSTINFPPGIPKVFKNKMDKFIVQRAYELPETIMYSFDELDE